MRILCVSGSGCGSGCGPGPVRAFGSWPAASLAAWSAASLPGTPTWAGVRRIWISQPRSWSVSTVRVASTRIHCPEGHLGLAIAWMAAWSSVKTVHLPRAADRQQELINTLNPEHAMDRRWRSWSRPRSVEGESSAASPSARLQARQQSSGRA